jgi:hypothetical protein
MGPGVHRDDGFEDGGLKAKLLVINYADSYNKPWCSTAKRLLEA